MTCLCAVNYGRTSSSDLQSKSSNPSEINLAVTALSLQHISKRFGSLIANDDISLTLGRGEVLALLGENGAGKSTLMNILFGHYVADSGSISVFGETLVPGKPQLALARGIGMVHQHFTLADNLSVLDNVMLGAQSLLSLRSQRTAAREQLNDLSQRFGLTVSPDAVVRNLSVGEKQRVEILKALYRGAKILILDEPTSVLTPQEVEQLFGTLRHMVAEGLSVIFISHKLDEVLAISTQIAVLRQGRLVHECAAREATNESLALAMVGRDVKRVQRAETDHTAPKSVALSVRSLALAHESSRVALSNVTFDVAAGEIVAIAGVSGNGQRLLADALSGLHRVATGQILLNGRAQSMGARAAIDAGVARIPEDRQHVGAVGDLSVWENAMLPRTHEARFSKLSWLNRGGARRYTDALVKQFDVRLSSIEQPIRMLSGGNMQKLILGRELDGAPSVVIAAQPTWGLDVGAVSFVHEQLLNARARGAAIVLISEDLDEVFALADRIAVMCDGRLTAARDATEWSLQSLGLAMAGHSDSQPSKLEAQHAT
ncbi:MAG: ABC transporter ATP-binding protein [Betaproteobacteria bacterium]|nr:MAG: ABC transporter ATP-binding protein [Betaproteobacteria bacterium]